MVLRILTTVLLAFVLWEGSQGVIFLLNQPSDFPIVGAVLGSVLVVWVVSRSLIWVWRTA